MLDIEKLSLRFPGFALHEICFSVAAAEYFVLFGPTGSGKTLLFELIAGLNRPDSGRIVIGGEDRTEADPADRRIGYVPQDLALIPFKTVWQNVAFGLHARPFRPAVHGKCCEHVLRERVDAMLEILGLAHLAKRRPAGLSGGEKQRVALGRALVIQPDLLLLDEPLSAVDEQTGNTLMREIKTLQRTFGITTLHICHRKEEMAFLADTVAHIAAGSIQRIGTPRDLPEPPDT